jgi:soluble lytic murein transglycosylase-like protein
MNIVTLMLTFASVTQSLNLPPKLLNAICYTESNYNVNAVHYHDGHGNSVGVCQIKLATARQFGFKGTERSLKDPSNNILYAGRYLQYQLTRYNGNVFKSVGAYNSGSFKAGLNVWYIRKVLVNRRRCL